MILGLIINAILLPANIFVTKKIDSEFKIRTKHIITLLLFGRIIFIIGLIEWLILFIKKREGVKQT